eukprot:8332398-Alexandrium_andersonii.AAC.1
MESSVCCPPQRTHGWACWRRRAVGHLFQSIEKYDRPTLGGRCLLMNWRLLAARSARMRGAM